MAVEVEIDVEVLKSEIKKTYASVSQLANPWQLGRLAPGERVLLDLGSGAGTDSLVAAQMVGARGTTVKDYKPGL
jgi:cyclopropane fatty-acyl-phospholipid synthase-like methyltransferase